MKRLALLISLVCVSLIADAQAVIRTHKDKNVTTVSSTVITKTKTKKVFKKYDAKVGFQHFVELGIRPIPNEKDATGINYIGGWRFNNWLFAGAGTGLNFAHDVAKGAKDYIGQSLTIYGDENYHQSRHYSGESFNSVSVPLYVHLRGYYMRTRWAPYSSISFGGDLAPKDCGVYFDFSTGVDFRLNSKLHLYSSLGFCLRGGRESSTDLYEYDYEYFGWDEICRSRKCPYYGSDRHTHYFYKDLYSDKQTYYNLSIRVGVSF